MRKLTVFTPTYNRAFCLGNCYQSLVDQTSQDFIWLIIDDGSTDDTEQLVNSWIEENKINIHYYKQENQGMHGAHNAAYERIETELNVCLDSDDIFHERAVERILFFWEKNGSDQVSGIAALNMNKDYKIIGSTFPEQVSQSTLYDLYHKHGVKGDKKLVYRTELTRKFPYPIFDGERYVGLDYKYLKIDENYKLQLMNEVLCIVEYLPDGSSNTMFSQYKRNPKGFSFYRKELMRLPFSSFAFKFRQAIHFVSSSLFEKNGNMLRNAPSKSLIIAAFPFGVVLHTYIRIKVSQLTQLKG